MILEALIRDRRTGSLNVKQGGLRWLNPLSSLGNFLTALTI